MSSLLVGIAGSAIVAIVYGLFIAQREDRIRGYLAARRSSWSRRRSVRAFVGAVRGDAALQDTAILLLFCLLIPAVLGIASINSARQVGDIIEQAEASLRTLDLATEEQKRERKELEMDLSGLLAEGRRLEGLAYATGTAALVATLYGVYVWAPFILLRRRFAYAIERFTLRLQALCDREDIAALALAEAQVKDEASLRSFVTVARVIALKNQVGGLAESFDLWAEPEPMQPPASVT